MAYREMWEIEVRHDGLNKFRHIRGSDRYVVEQKAAVQKIAWDEMWEKKQAAEEKKREREATIRSKEEKKELAVAKTEEAQKAINGLEKILEYTLAINDKIDWASLLDKKPFPQREPIKPKANEIPAEPSRSDSKYQPKIGFFDKIFSSSRKRKQDEAESLYLSDHKSWIEVKRNIESKNAKTEVSHANAVEQWRKEKIEYEQNQKANNELIVRKKEQYLQMEPGAVADYCEMVLNNSIYPDYFPKEWDIDYQINSKILIVDYSLPDIDSIPTVKSIKYVISRDEFTESHLSSAALNKLYDNLLYQIALRTIHELYEADAVEALDSIVFNGWVDTVDKATGQNVNSCIMSLQASKDEFLAINLEKVDPKACFKQLKGVGSAKLHGLSPVAPIISIDKEDRRFISAYAVVNEIDSGDNLAAMDWKDFENLIREIFEKEFVSSGGEVKITRASRDGGVDAVAFDPDPIRGGKIVIQAKRYSNVVGVSAVRDLFGTTVNEGATKGILVTTADYGPDAYEFAKGKPLTLLNGGNLLHLLEKHGHKARIDLKEAKLILNEQKI
jgi:restriction system protein